MHPPSKRILIQHLSNWHRNTPNPSRLLFISSKVHEIFKYSLQFFKNPSSKFSKNLWKIIFQVYEIFKYSFKLLKNPSTFSQIHYISFKSWNILFKSSKLYDIFKYSLKFLKKSTKFLLNPEKFFENHHNSMKYSNILWNSSRNPEKILKFLWKSGKILKILWKSMILVSILWNIEIFFQNPQEILKILQKSLKNSQNSFENPRKSSISKCNFEWERKWTGNGSQWMD